MISSFITTPLTVLAETTSPSNSAQQIQAGSTKPEESITKETEVNSTSQVDSPVKEATKTTTSDSSTLESAQTDQKQASETTQSTDMQTRGSPIDDSGYTKLILSLDPPRSENKYYTGENIQFYQTIESSNEQVNEGLYSLIKIPKKFVDKDTIKVNADTSIKNYQIIENEADEWVIRIDYKTVVSGGIVSFPITFQQRNYTTPPDSETKVLSELFYESKLLSTDSFSVYANTVTPSLTKNVHSNYIKNGTVNIGLASKDDKNVSSKNKNELNTILYDMRATIGTKEGNGIFINNNSEIVDVLPETTKFDEMSEYSNNWEYDSKNNTISFKITKDSKIYNGSVQALLPVYFPDTEGGKSVSNTAELRDINNITVSDATTKFIPSIEPNEPYISGGAWKYAQGETYNRAIGEQPDEITWTVYPYISDNPFNKQAYIKEIEDIVDENQYYTQFKVSMPKNTSFDFIDFYAAKEDGVYKLIQEKIPTDEDILISRDYRKIKIVYRTPVLFDKDIRLYPKTKVQDKIWEYKMDGKRIENTGKVTYTDPEGNTLGVGSMDANVTYSSPKIQFYTTIEKEGSGLRKEIQGNINDIVNINYQVSFKNVSAADEPTIVTILPSGVVPNSEIKNGSIVNNYLGTGQTAILQKVTERKYESFSSDIPVKLTKNVSKGLNKIQHYIYWENQKITPVPAGSYNQRYSSISKNNAIDFDNQGTFLGKDILSDYDEIDYYPPLEVMILKKIGTTPQSLSENPIEVEASQDIYYELSLENRTNKAIEDYYFYDILPFKGDKLNDQQDNSDRGSTDNVLFSQIVSKDNNLDVYYSSENQIDSINDFTWYKLDSNTPKENIKTLKFVPTVKLEPNQVMKVLFRVSTASNSANNSILNSALLTQENKNTLLDSNIVEAKVLKNETTEVKGTKTWNDANNQDGKRPDKITVNLLADGEQVATKEVTEADGWAYEFKDLPKFKDGNEIVYTVTENQLADYNTEVKGFNLTNSYTPGKTSISVTKKWEDANNQDGKRPNSIQVQLLADGQKQGDVVELNAANNWTTTWNDLAQKANGKDIVYTIEEVKVPGYTTTVDDTDKGNILLTNTYAPETTEVKGTKTWNDANNQDGKRPDKITVNLLADGEQVATKEVTEADGWAYEFKDLPKFKDGKEIVYTVTENTVKDYTTKIKGYNITNTYNPGKISGIVTKRWEDTNNQDGLRPNSVKIQLYANGKKQGQPVELTEKGHWTYSWKELDATDKDGKGIQYSIKEVDVVDGYIATITGENTGNLLITNTHTPTTPNKPKTPAKPETPSTPGKHLPKTGEVNAIWWTVVGALLISSVGGYLYFRKKVER